MVDLGAGMSEEAVVEAGRKGRAGVMLVVIVNHNHNAEAISLKRRFAALAPTRLLDSGSALAPDERAHFSECLPNVFYSGLLNRTAEWAAGLRGDAPVLLVCSDVAVAEPAELLSCMADAFADPKLMVWAPCAAVRSFPHMNPAGSGGLRRVSFTDGFCFAARKSLWDAVCPVDVSVNRLGWGPDVQFAYVALTMGGWCAVDDRIEVRHPDGPGYDPEEAMRQYRAWRSGFAFPARLFHAYARRDENLEGLRSRLTALATVALYRLWRAFGAANGRRAGA